MIYEYNSGTRCHGFDELIYCFWRKGWEDRCHLIKQKDAGTTKKRDKEACQSWRQQMIAARQEALFYSRRSKVFNGLWHSQAGSVAKCHPNNIWPAPRRIA